MSRLIVVLFVVMVVVALSEQVTGARSDVSRLAGTVKLFVYNGSPSRHATSGAVRNRGGKRPRIYRGNRRGNRYTRYRG
ncbi:hypothetical protein O3P69_007669 [Scylla paramamosain]|uniref:Uncharacterized protein n=1 Tax=Scylla paramamosain TaxID=85552 RepID=A0AAW0V1T5_SCYPA